MPMPNKTYKCKFCDFKCRAKSLMKNHIFKQHEEELFTYVMDGFS